MNIITEDQLLKKDPTANNITQVLNGHCGYVSTPSPKTWRGLLFKMVAINLFFGDVLGEGIIPYI